MSKVADWDCFSGSAREVFTSATLGGAKGLGRSDLGRIAVGALADIAIVNMQTINNVPCRDPVKNLVNSASRADVEYVMVDGRLVIDEKELLVINEAKLLEEVQEATQAIWDRIPENHYQGLHSDDVSPQSFKPWNPEE
jgi:cytosine/adenosine deaminase-related metal-dependent hydrolase